MDYKGGPTHVTVQQPQQFVVASVKEPFHVCTLVASVIAVCCCSCCGFPAMVISLMSYSDHSVNDLGRYRSKKSTACGLAVAAIVIGSLSIAALILMYIFGVFFVFGNRIE